MQLRVVFDRRGEFASPNFGIRKLPVTYLGFGHMSLTHKVYSFLHVLFLECGPDIGLLRWRLSRIRGWCTDWGVEAQVANTPDLLPDFLAAIGCPLRVARETYLFPRAVWMPGWHHHWDNIVKHALSALPWWAVWLKELKTVVKFMRVESYRTELATQAKRCGFDHRFTNLTPPNFAEWRWSTLFLTCAWLVPNIPVFDKIWSISLFAKAKDGAVIRAVNAALTSETWWLRLRVVRDGVSLAHACRVWGAGCHCHEAERRQGKQVHCSMAGRRLPEAELRVQEFVRACHDRADRPGEGDLCSAAELGKELSRERAWVFKCLAAMCEKKFGYLAALPYSLARCRDRDRMRAARDEFSATTEARRHRVAIEFFGEGGLASDVEAFISQGILSDKLSDELGSLERLPLTEEIVEAPRAEMQREKVRQRAASRVWQSCTNRLESNLELQRTMDEGMRTVFAAEWRRAKRVLQVHPGRAHRPARVSWRRAKILVYKALRISSCVCCAGKADRAFYRRECASHDATPCVCDYCIESMSSYTDRRHVILAANFELDVRLTYDESVLSILKCM